LSLIPLGIAVGGGPLYENNFIFIFETVILEIFGLIWLIHTGMFDNIIEKITYIDCYFCFPFCCLITYDKKKNKKNNKNNNINNINNTQNNENEKNKDNKNKLS